MSDPYMQFEAGNCGLSQIIRGLFLNEIFQRNYSAIKTGAFATNTRASEIIQQTPWKFVCEYGENQLNDGFFYDSSQDTIIYLDESPGNIGWNIAGHTMEQVTKTFESIKVLCPAIPSDGSTMPINFWNLSPHGATARRRELIVPSWEEVKDNYPSKTRTHLNSMMNMVKPEGSGKLILWHGVPGTGKSSCIRSLAHEWNAWSEIHYIVDPERFFGEAFYLMDVILSEPNEKGKWRLLIIEDADEFLVSDAKQRSGQALSRLLNCTDGLIGQGLGLLTIITTNEPITKIHPAISREGRCLANIEFPKFSPVEAVPWLSNHMVSADVWPVGVNTKDWTLAELYEATRKTHIKQELSPDRIGVYI